MTDNNERVECIQTDSKGNTSKKMISLKLVQNIPWMEKNSLIYQGNGKTPTQVTETQETNTTENTKKVVELNLKAIRRDGDVIYFENKSGDSITLDFNGMGWSQEISDADSITERVTIHAEQTQSTKPTAPIKPTSKATAKATPTKRKTKKPLKTA